VAAGREPSAEAQEGSSQSPSPPGLARRLKQGSEKDTQEGEGEGEAGMAREGGLPTSDPADGGHMAAASQIKRLRLGGSAITAV